MYTVADFMYADKHCAQNVLPQTSVKIYECPW